MNPLEELSSLLSPAQIRTDPELLWSYGRDQSLAKPCLPEAVVLPESAGQVRAAIQWANRCGLPLVPVSSGAPRHRGDTVPGLGGVVLDLQNLKRIIRIDRRNRVCLVEPGLTFAELLPELKKKGLRLNLPLHPRANKSVVASVLEREPLLMPRYQWDSSDPLCCTEVVFGSGELFWTGEAAGPGSLERQWEGGGAQKFPLGPHQVDYHRLLQGAQGTLGVVTWASIKCELDPDRTQLCRFAADRLEALLPLAYQVMRHDLGDEVLLLNALHLSCLLQEQPEEIDALTGTLSEWHLVIRLSGGRYQSEERISYQSQDLAALAKEHGLQPARWGSPVRDVDLERVLSSPCPGKYWKSRCRGAFQELLCQSTLDRVPGLLQVAKQSLAEQGVAAQSVGMYVQPLVQGTSCHLELCLFYDPADRVAREAVERAMRASAGDLLRAGAFFPRPYYPWASMVYERQAGYRDTLKKIKTVFDPNHVLNPGKLCF